MYRMWRKGAAVKYLVVVTVGNEPPFYGGTDSIGHAEELRNGWLTDIQGAGHVDVLDVSGAEAVFVD